MRARWNKLIVALDETDKKKILRIVECLSPRGVIFKIGPIAFTAFGPGLVSTIVARGAKVFVDFKLYDIPNTMAETAKQLVRLGTWAFTVHVKAGREALTLVREETACAACASKATKPLILGVTELTSNKATPAQILDLAAQAKEAGLEGVIASAQEAKAIKEKFGKALLVVTPGIRNPHDQAGDQRRITTAQTAFSNGADYIVVGRPIVSKTDYLEAAADVLSQ